REDLARLRYANNLLRVARIHGDAHHRRLRLDPVIEALPGEVLPTSSLQKIPPSGPFVDSRERRTKAETQIMPSSGKGLIKEVASNESSADAACAKSVKTGMIDGEREFCCSRIRRARTIGDGFTDGR